MPSDTRPIETHILFVGESAKTFCADFQDYPEVANGETLSSPTISVTNPSGGTLVTVSTATVLTAAFIEYDRDGVEEDRVPSGKGVSFLAYPTSATPGSTNRGQVTVTVLVAASGGATLGKQINFVVK